MASIDFTEQYLPAAVMASERVYQNTGHFLDPNAILAQAALETGWGKSAPGNNFFGIKGKGQKHNTKEFIGGKMVGVEDSFRSYTDPSQSFLDYADLISNDRYKGGLQFSSKAPETHGANMASLGYATDPNYGTKFRQVFERILGKSLSAIIPEAKAEDDPWAQFTPVTEGPAAPVDQWAQFTPVDEQQATTQYPPEGWSRNAVKPAAGMVDIGGPGNPLLNRIAGQNVRGSVIGRIGMGMADPSVAAGQIVANLTPWGQDVNNAIADKEKQFQSVSTNDGGIDWWRVGGNIAAPASILAARLLPGGGGIKSGMKAGGVGGLLTPVTDAQSIDDFWGVKAMQGGAGAAAGGVLNPIVSKVVGGLSGIVQKVVDNNPEIKGAEASIIADEAMKKVMADLGPDASVMPKNVVDDLRQQVINALKEGKQIDAAVLARKMDFDRLGIKPTQGQITRDATQYATEKNLRGIANVGEPLMQTFEEQNKRLTGLLTAPMRGNALPSNQAGEMISGSLKQLDDQLRGAVSSAYKVARESSGKDLVVKTTGLAQDYAQVLDDFGDKIPSGVRKGFEDLGLLDGVQRKMFTIDEAEKLLKRINDNVTNDPASNTALSRLRDAVKNAVMSADDEGGVFAAPRELAAKRFKLQDAIPALKASATGEVNADKFVDKYIINAPTKDVRNLSKVLDEASLDEARRQVGNRLYRAAFGENVTGDKPFSAERYLRELRSIGPDKLRAFFTEDEVSRFQTLGRVGAYIHTHPNASPVQHSNNIAAFGGLLQRIPGAPAALNAAMAAKAAMERQSTVRSAVNPTIPTGRAPLTTEQQNALDFITRFGLLSTGSAAASGL